MILCIEAGSTPNLAEKAPLAILKAGLATNPGQVEVRMRSGAELTRSIELVASDLPGDSCNPAARIPASVRPDRRLGAEKQSLSAW
jgi:hypothetical protein